MKKSKADLLALYFGVNFLQLYLNFIRNNNEVVLLRMKFILYFLAT